MRRFALLPVFALLLAVANANPAAAQYENRALNDKVERLERDMQTLQQAWARGGNAPVISSAPVASAPGGMALRLDDRVDQLEDQIRQLTGKLEETNWKSAQVAKQVERLQADMELRFKEMQAAAAAPQAQPQPQLSMPAPGGAPLALSGANSAEGPGMAPGPTALGTLSEKDLRKLAPPAAAPQPAAVPAGPKDPQVQYDEAYAAAQRGDYAAAEKGFQDFLAKNPKHQLAGNAQYWLGDIAYARKDFKAAAAQFVDAYKNNPKHNKAPDMLFKLGSSFGQLNMKPEACKALDMLFRDQPNMPERVRRAALAEKQKDGCK